MFTFIQSTRPSNCVPARSCNPFRLLMRQATDAVIAHPKPRTVKANMLGIHPCQLSRAENDMEGQTLSPETFYNAITADTVTESLQRTLPPFQPVAETRLDPDGDRLKGTAADREWRAREIAKLVTAYADKPSDDGAWEMYRAASELYTMHHRNKAAGVAQ